MTAQTREQHGASAGAAAERDATVRDLVERARASCAGDDPASASEYCDEALSIDPENAGAWDVLARCRGWDPKLRVLDADAAMAAVKHALDLVSGGRRYRAASEAYRARKRQIVLMLEPDLMMPSYTSARHLHETMLLWLRLLQEVPCLSSNLIEGEIALCDAACRRSKLGLAPGERLAYAAFSSFNHKESYGETFRRALFARLEEARGREAAAKAAALEHVEGCRVTYEVWMECEHPGCEAEKARLEGDALLLESDLDLLLNLNDEEYYQQQINDLDQRLSKLKGLNLIKKHTIRAQIGSLQGKISRIEEEFGPVLEPLQSAIARIRMRIAEIDRTLMEYRT